MNSESQNLSPTLPTMRRTRSGFTLVELMISIALALVLMVGINQVFKMTGEAVGAGQTISEQVRDARSAQAVFQPDFDRMANDAPLCINMMTQPAFRNAADRASDIDYNPTDTTLNRYRQMLTTDIDGNGTEGETTALGERIPRSTYNFRNHRVDTISFFARGLFARQTGGNATGTLQPLVADMTGTEAWIWYGHLALANNENVPAYYNPGVIGAGKNDNNIYASQWVFGRQQMILVEPDASGYIYDTQLKPPPHTPIKQIYFNSPNPKSPAPVTEPCLPLAVDSEATPEGAQLNPRVFIQDSRFDLVAGSITGFNTLLQSKLFSVPDYFWWEALFGVNTARPTPGNPASDMTRFQSASFIQRPAAGLPLVNAASFAKLQPAFLPGCAQFIVEYAGDFVAQDDDGLVTDVYSYEPIASGDPGGGQGTDGVTDYIVVGKDPDRQRQIRWYGLPRDIDGDGVIPIDIGGNVTNPNRSSPDVLPLVDVIRSSTRSSATGSPFNGSRGAPFERYKPVTPVSDYAAEMSADDYYTVAFAAGDRKPTMIRITIVLDDPLGRLPDGQTFEYVYKLDSGK